MLIYIYLGTKKGELTVPQKSWFQLDTGTWFVSYGSQSGNKWCWEVAWLPAVVWSVVKPPALFPGVQHLHLVTSDLFFLPKPLPCRSVQHHDSKPPPQCCTLQWFTFSSCNFIHSEFCIQLSADSHCLSPWTANSWLGWTWERTSAISSEWCRSKRTTWESYRTPDAKTRSWVTSTHSVWSELFVNFWGTVFSVKGFRKYTLFFIKNIYTFCYNILLLPSVTANLRSGGQWPIDNEYFFPLWVVHCSLGHCVTSMKWYN